MVRAPLNVIPQYIVTVLQTKVSAGRIAQFLDEPEVDAQFSGLKQPPSSGPPAVVAGEEVREAEKLGIVNGWFKWNEVDRSADDKPEKTTIVGRVKGLMTSFRSRLATRSMPGSSILPTARASAALLSVPSDSGSSAKEERRFELRDINVVFPDGKMTVVTGPTASGKSALLVSRLIYRCSSANVLVPRWLYWARCLPFLPLHQS